MRRLRFFKNTLFLLLIVVISSCGKKSTVVEQTPTNEAAVAMTPVPEAKPVEEIGSNDGLITFLTGEISLMGLDGRSVPEIGDPVVSGDVIVTGADGYAELQFGNLGAVRVQSDTQFTVENITLTSDGGRASGSLLVGSVIAKIRKLTDEDAFEIGVPGAVCAVRGTQFMVSASDSGEVKVAVAEGRVAVAPPSLAEVGSEDEFADVPDAIIDTLPVVEPNEVYDIPIQEMAEAETEINVWKEGDRLSPRDTEEPATTDLKERLAAVFSKVQAPRTMEAAEAEEIQDAAPEMIPMAMETRTGSDESIAAPALMSLTVVSHPENTRIIVNEKPAGVGRVSRVFSEGSRVSLLAISADGRRQEKDLVLESPSVVEFIFEELEPEAVEEEISLETVDEDIDKQTVPPPANNSETTRIEPVGNAEATAVVLDTAEPVDEPDPDEPESTEAVVEGTGTLPQNQAVTVELITEPTDAEILLDGEILGMGRVSVDLEPGDHREVTVRRAGYMEAVRPLSVNTASRRMRFQLKPRPIAGRSPLPGPGIGTLKVHDGGIYGVTRNGAVFAYDGRGRSLWNISLGGAGRALTLEVSDYNAYLMSGDKLYVIDLRTGRVKNESVVPIRSRSPAERRPVLVGDYLVVPTGNTLMFADPNSGEHREVLEIPKGSDMSPVLWDDKVLIADRRGTLLYINPQYQIISRTIDMGVGQPEGHAAAVSRSNVAVYAGSDGAVCAVDLNSATGLWERTIGGGVPGPFSHDPVIAGSIAYFYSGGKVFALNLRSGDDAFAPIPGLTSPPLIHDGIIYAGNDEGRLVLYSARNGRLIGDFTIGEKIYARPAMMDGHVIVAGERNLVIVDPRSLSE